jgi:hypothetical protein
MKLKVTYDGKDNSKLDKKIIKLVRKFGYTHFGNGYNFKKNERDIAFRKED